MQHLSFSLVIDGGFRLRAEVLVTFGRDVQGFYLVRNWTGCEVGKGWSWSMHASLTQRNVNLMRWENSSAAMTLTAQVCFYFRSWEGGFQGFVSFLILVLDGVFWSDKISLLVFDHDVKDVKFSFANTFKRLRSKIHEHLCVEARL